MKHTSSVSISASGIGIILATIIFGPLLSPPEFSWIHHSISKQASQQLRWASNFSRYSVGIGDLAEL